MNKKISVLLSVYNGSEWLEECIQSVLKQSYESIEFIIIDDGSIDSSRDIIDKYSNKDSRIVKLYKKNTGLADSLNIGLGIATGEWIARIDADDICESNRLESLLEKVRNSNGNVLIGSSHFVINEKGEILSIVEYPESNQELRKRLYHRGAFYSHSSVIYRRDIVKKIGGYRGVVKKAEDYDLWLRLSECGNIASVKQPLVRIRKHANQVSNEKAGLQQIRDSYLALVSHYLRKSGGVDPLENRFYEHRLSRNFVEYVYAKVDEWYTIEYMRFSSSAKYIIKERGLLQGIFFSLSNYSCLFKYVALRYMSGLMAKNWARQWSKNSYDSIYPRP